MKRFSLIVVVLGCLTAAVAVAPASAASLARSCRASALRASLGGGTLSEPTAANRPDAPCATDAAGAPSVDLTPVPAQAKAVYAVTNLTNGPFGVPGQTAAAASGATNVNIGVPGTPSFIAADVVSSAVTTTCDGNTPVYNTAGQVASLTLGGQPVPLDGLVTQLADGLNGLLGTIVQIKLNQVTLTPSGDGFVYRRRAVEVQVLPASGGAALIDAVAGEAQVNRSGGVCDVPNPPLQCPSGASFDAKSGSCVVLQVVPGTGNPSAPCPPGANQTESGSCVVTVTVNALGQGSGQGAGGNAKRCVDTRGFRIPLPFHARGRVTGATVYVNGRVKRVARGRNIRAIVVKRLPQGRFKVLIVARTSRGFTVTSVRSYIGCRKTPRRDRVNRRARHRH